MSCRFPEAALHDYLDGGLDGVGRRRVEAHLESCAACRELLADLVELGEKARALPREVEPPRDLWPAIEGRLAPRRTAPAPAWRRWQQLAAAILLLAAGGLLSRWLLPPVERPATAGHRAAATVDHALAVGDYQRARAALEASVAARRDALDPATLAVVERNLRIIDQAIRELEAALAADPENPNLSRLLLASYQREIDLLQRLAAPPRS